ILSISTSKEKINSIKVSIKDNGIGIAKDQLDKIFDRFYQVSNSSVREYEGTGIGLALVKELITLHHGTLEVNSEPGKGSEFVFYLPADPNVYSITDFTTVDSEDLTYPYLPQEEINHPTDNHLPLEKNQVLIIEDNSDFRAFTRSVLENEYEVIEAVDGMNGWELALEKIPDLIVADMMMPKLDGLELCKKVKEDIHTNHIPIILLTARQAIDYKIKGLETGADDYLTKPFHTQELQARIKNLIAQREKLKEKYNKANALLKFDTPVTSANEKFLNLLTNAIEKHLTSSEFDVELLSHEVAMSRVQLFRKLKALTGQAPSDFIRIYKLNKAANLLSKGAFENISEVAYACGFNSPSYFTESFRKQFGKSPSEFLKDK
ncbi:MAG TPA: response regulator, partial [Cyclobacteriaceae bacterium]